MNRLIIFLVGLLAANIIFCQENSASVEDQLIIFTQPANQHFIKTTSPLVRAYCAEKGITLIERTVEEGTPADIVSTPALIFQNFRGRSIYSSRYAEFATIKNFIRTSRIVPQKQQKNCKETVLIWQNGRTQIAANLKITPLSGQKPKGFSADQFQSIIRQAINTGMTNYLQKELACLSKTDRLFYLDVHPYRDKKNHLFVSIELYSKFSCKIPVFSLMNAPIEGSFDDLTTVFTKVGQIFQQEITQQMEASTIGDAFHPISDDIPIQSWEVLGLNLPTAPKMLNDLINTSIDLPQDWTFTSGIDEETPIVQFRFMEPLDRYVGEIRSIDGTLKLSATRALQSGYFTATMQSLTMGMEDFDKVVLSKYIKALKFPKSSFSFENDQSEALQIGETTFIKVNGVFDLMKKKRTVSVAAQLTPIIGTTGNVLLQVSASFSLNIVDDFGIKGPDGPDPARKTMLFDLNFLMKPNEKQMNP